jgi:molybdenum cofactor cytidylyltransferase
MLPPVPAVGIVILAAGESRRMGEPKQLLRFEGRTLLRRAVDAALASACRPIVVTIGAHRALIEPELQGLPVIVAPNPDWRQGMSSSLRVGLDALHQASGDVAGAVIALADQPLVGTGDFMRLVRVHRQTGKPIVASAYAGTRGVPMFIAAELFGEAMGLAGTAGAKALIARHPDRVASVVLAAGAVDIDSPADFARLLQP